MTQVFKGLIDNLDVFDFQLSDSLYQKKTLTSNLIGNSGVVDDLLLDSAGGQGPVAAVVNDVVAQGGIIENLANGGGLGVEGVLHHVTDSFGFL